MVEALLVAVIFAQLIVGVFMFRHFSGLLEDMQDKLAAKNINEYLTTKAGKKEISKEEPKAEPPVFVEPDGTELTEKEYNEKYMPAESVLQ